MPDRTLLWIGCGGCSGETQALLGVEGQACDLLDLLEVDGLRLLWHPSLAERELGPVHAAVAEGREPLTVLCVEGSVALAQDGMFDLADGTGKYLIVASLCERADYVLAMGACAGYGGWQAQPPNPSGAVGLLQSDLGQPTLQPPAPDDTDPDARGFGHANATRGTLMHWVTLSHGKIATYQGSPPPPRTPAPATPASSPATSSKASSASPPAKTAAAPAPSS